MEGDPARLDRGPTIKQHMYTRSDGFQFNTYQNNEMLLCCLQNLLLVGMYVLLGLSFKSKCFSNVLWDIFDTGIISPARHLADTSK